MQIKASELKTGDVVVCGNGSHAVVEMIIDGPEPRGRRCSRREDPPPLRAGFRRVVLSNGHTETLHRTTVVEVL